MKISKRYIPFVVLALALALFAACASTDDTSGTGEYLDDAVVTTKVKAAIFNEPTLKSLEINVETFKGEVQLSGFVSSQTDIDTAVRITRGVKGVNAVRNDMQVK